MGRIWFVYRLAARDLCRRPAQAALLLLAITAATTTLTLGLILHGVTSQPYESTREATAGPDVVASAIAADGGGVPAELRALAGAAGVAAHSGPYPYTQATVEVNGVAVTAWTQGRDTAPAPVDQPALTDGGWVREGGAVVEATFAEALGVGAGDQLTIAGTSFEVTGVAVTAAMAPYPKVCFAPCWFDTARPPPPPERTGPPPEPPPPAGSFRLGASGLIWLTEADARGLASQVGSLGYVTNLELDHPDRAKAFVEATLSGAESVDPPSMATWQDILDGHGWVVETKREVLLTGGWLLSLLALASITVLVGGRMADQLRRVGQLKAVGGTPRLIAAVLLAEHAAVAVVAAGAGLVAGRLAAPLLTDPGASLLGNVDTVPLTLSTVVFVIAAALGIAGVATFVPAVRAARISTVRALAGITRPPRRVGWLIAVSARLPVPLLLGLRVAARRPRRTVLGLVAVAITVTGTVAALAGYANRVAEQAPGSDPRTDLSQALSLITLMLFAQAAVNVVCIAWATALDTRRSSALARALGATPGRLSAGLAAAQVLPALAGAVLGLAGGIGLAEILDDDPVAVPAPWQLLAVVLGYAAVIAALTAIPARISARRPPGPILQAERT